jgi:hypothetical protein
MLMSKYDRFGDYLRGLDPEEVTLTFEEIERVLGFALPESKRHAALWANSGSNWPLTKVWAEAGWRARAVNTREGRVTFYRVRPKNLSEVGASDLLDLKRLSPVASSVLTVLARRSGRSLADEALTVLNESLA